MRGCGGDNRTTIGFLTQILALSTKGFCIIDFGVRCKLCLAFRITYRRKNKASGQRKDKFFCTLGLHKKRLNYLEQLEKKHNYEVIV